MLIYNMINYHYLIFSSLLCDTCALVEDEGNVPRSAALDDGVPGMLQVGKHGDRRSDPSLKPRHDGLVPGVA